MVIEEYVAKNTCGSCRHFKFEGNREKGKCDKFWTYYWPCDSCKNHWEEASDVCGGKRPIDK